MSDSLWPLGLYSPWNSPGQNTGVGSLSLFQGIFPTQRSNPGLPHCRWILYQLSHQRSPRILEWVAYPFSSGSSQPRSQTRVSCIAGGFFTNWAIREASYMRILWPASDKGGWKVSDLPALAVFSNSFSLTFSMCPSVLFRSSMSSTPSKAVEISGVVTVGKVLIFYTIHKAEFLPYTKHQIDHFSF